MPANSPSGSSAEAGRVLSIMAKAKDSGLEKERMLFGVSEVNSELRDAALVKGPGGMCE